MQQNVDLAMVTTRGIVEEERLLFAIKEVVLLNPHLPHFKPFSFGDRRSKILSQGGMKFIPVT
jgi:hypothetical protein